MILNPLAAWIADDSERWRTDDLKELNQLLLLMYWSLTALQWEMKVLGTTPDINLKNSARMVYLESTKTTQRESQGNKVANAIVRWFHSSR